MDSVKAPASTELLKEEPRAIPENMDNKKNGM